MALVERWTRGWALAATAALGVLGLTLAACARGGAEAGSPERRPASGVLPPCGVERVPLAIDPGTHIYVEPEELLRVRSGFVVVGSPSYVYGPGPDGSGVQLSADRHLAARFTLDGRAVAIPKPIDGVIGSVRAAPLEGERWGVLFHELHPDSIERVHGPVALWYAEHDAGRWSVLERVPLPERGRLDFSSSSELVPAGAELAWIVAVRLETGSSELHEYTRSGGRWDHRMISDDWVEVSALAYDADAGDLWMAHFSEDRTLPGWQQSLRLYRRRASWELVAPVAVVDPGVKVHDPSLSVGAGGIGVAWRVESRDGFSAYAVADAGADDIEAPVILDGYALQVVALGSGDGRPRWVVRHLEEGERRVDVRLLRLTSDAALDELVSAPDVYRSGFLAALPVSATEVIVAGADVSLDPANSFLRSLILRLSTSCT